MAKGNKPVAKETRGEAEEIKAVKIEIEPVIPEFVRVVKNGVTVTRHYADLQQYIDQGWKVVEW